MAKRFDPKAKARKQKIVLAVLGVLFLGVIVYQAPTILGLFGGGSSEVASEPAPPSPVPAAPAPGAPAPATPAAAPGSGSAALIDSDPVAQAAQGQLVTFDRFESKDPFAQQAEQGPVTAAPAEPARRRGDQPSGFEEAEPESPESAAPPAAAPVRTARISVNGISSDVTVGGTFPEGDPIFKLLSLKAASAKVGIVDGTYATGAQGITLRKGGKPVTLMNTADGTTYVLRLVSVK
jgi:hypothetical protein